MTRSTAWLRSIHVSSLLLFSLCVLVACGPSREVDDVDSKKQTDYSGPWNEADALMVADTLIGGRMLRGEWLQHWEKNHEGPPTVTIGPIKNKTMQHIDEEIFIKDIERNLVNSGKVQFVATADERTALRCGRGMRCERTRSPADFTKKKALELAAETGTDFMVQGTISSAVQDSLAENKAAISYTVSLELIDIEKNATAWFSETEIKKIVKRSEGTM